MNWRLVFSGLKSPEWVAFAGLGVILAIIISIWLLRLERKLVSRTVGWTLLTLRILVLLTLLITLLQPVITQRFSVSQNGRIVVAIDGSESMETQDRHAALGEKLRWAQALGMLGNAETNPMIDEWVAAAESGKEPNWFGGDALPVTAAEQALSEARFHQVTESLNELAGMPRVEFVQRLLQSKPNEVLTQLESVMPVDLRMFASRQEASAPEQLSAAMQSDRASLLPGDTDVLQFLTTIISEEDAASIRGVVLITDGRQTAAGDPAGTAQRLASLKIPVYAVPIGSRLPPRDLTIAAVDSPEAVFLNDKAQIRAVIGTSGFEGETLTIRLKRGEELVKEEVVTPSSDNSSVTFDVPADTAGRFDYRLETELQPGELRDDNNHRDISLQVVDNKAGVMLVDGEARWEFRYLKNLLDRDKQVKPLSILMHQPFLGLLNQPFIPDKLPEIKEFQEQLSVTDLLVIGDVGPQEISPAIWDIIEQAVSQDGLTLVVIPGRNHMPHGLSSPALAALLPVADSRQRVAEKFRATMPDDEQTSYRLSLHPDAASLPMFQLSAAGRNNSFADLPGHPWIYGGVPKPGASVWATATIPGVEIPPEPAILHHNYGFGQVVWMGLDSTWRWRRRAGDEWHYRFWGQMIRWAARNKTAAGNENVRMSLSDVVINESETIEALVRWNPKLLPQLEGAVVEVVAIQTEAPSPDPAGNTQPQDAVAMPAEHVAILSASADAAERYTGRLPPLSAGAWTVSLRVKGGSLATDEKIQSEVLVQRQLSRELANVSCNRELLTQLADLTNGAVVEPFEATRLARLIRPDDLSEIKLQEITLWDHWMVVLVFFTLLMSEWVLRKLNGLP